MCSQYRAAVAQLVEQGPLKPKVPGSIPGRCTKKTSHYRDVFDSVLFCMNMSIENKKTKVEGPLTKEESTRIDEDRAALRSYSEAHNLRHLEGRIEHGLDPSGMLAVEDSRLLAEEIAEKLGTSIEECEAFIAELHTTGPWVRIEELRNGGTTLRAKMYLTLAGVCGEKLIRKGQHSPREYIDDRNRVMRELTSLNRQDRKKAEQEFEKNLQERVYDLSDKEIIEINGVEVILASGDPFIAMAAEGFEGGISKSGPDGSPDSMYFVGTQSIDERSITMLGFVPVFAEVPGSPSLKRVEIGSEEAKKGRIVYAEPSALDEPLQERVGKLKKIAGGLFLAYNNKDLAIQLLGAELFGRKHNYVFSEVGTDETIDGR